MDWVRNFENCDKTLLPLNTSHVITSEFLYIRESVMFTVQASLLGVSPFIDINMKLDFSEMEESVTIAYQNPLTQLEWYIHWQIINCKAPIAAKCTVIYRAWLKGKRFI